MFESIVRGVIGLTLAGACLASSGCGILTTRTVEGVPETPFYSAPVDTPRPTALVRRWLGGAQLGAARDAIAASGLFASVAHQEGFGRPIVPTDYVLDVEVESDNYLAWYVFPGTLTLGVLPLGLPHEQVVTLVVRDSQLRELQRVRREAGGVRVFWIPFLPVSLATAAFDDDPTSDWSFSPGREEAQDERQRRGLLLSALAEAWERVGFAVPEDEARRPSRTER